MRKCLNIGIVSVWLALFAALFAVACDDDNTTSNENQDANVTDGDTDAGDSGTDRDDASILTDYPGCTTDSCGANQKCCGDEACGFCIANDRQCPTVVRCIDPIEDPPEPGPGTSCNNECGSGEQCCVPKDLDCDSVCWPKELACPDLVCPGPPPVVLHSGN